MSVKKMFAIVYSSAIIILLILGILALLLTHNQKLLSRSQQIRYESYLLGDELRQSSDDLTRLARTYCVTSDSKHEARYWEILDIRNGKKPRPDGRTVSLRKLMEDLNFSQQEFGKLKEAEDNSNGLVKTETIAMNAVKGLFDDGTGKFTKKGEPDLELARRIMHDEKYHQDKAIIMNPIDEFFRMLDQRTQSTVDYYERRSALYLWSIVGLVATFFVFALLSILVTARSIFKPLRRVIMGCAEAADQVATASVQVSSASQQVAGGASEQAASIEETSSSLEEMASMTRQNAENAAHANQLMSEATQVVERANGSMSSLTSSMTEISRASEETQKIIKTIDEIAFQTNLLALNAAVEAARAGEAGAGFAVVADEVRNLAMRAADAAKNTANLIEGTVKKVKEGTAMVTQTNDEFHQVAATVTKSGELVGEIAAASQEQAQGIDQVNRAVSDMDRVTQQNSANAEESAAASEEMNAQAGQMREFVASLVALVGGNGSEKGNGRQSHSIAAAREQVQVNVATPASRKTLAHSGKGGGKGKGTELTVSKRGTREVKPEQVIPFEGEEFKDF